MLKLERHAHGPRLYVLGFRIHEYQTGLALLAALAVALAAGLLEWTPLAGGLLLVGGWLVAKDWRDLLPSYRDTASWRLGLHRVATPLRAVRRAEGLSTLAAAVASTIGLVNLLSALTPNIGWRGRLLLQLEPVAAVPLFHTLALPASAALIVAGFYLARRRHRAWQAAFALLVVLGALNVLKGLDVEEALLSWAGAALLWWGRDEFHVRHDPLRGGALLVPAALWLGAATLTATLIWLTSPVHPGLALLGRETVDLLTWQRGPLTFGDELTWLPTGVGLSGLAGLLLAAYVLFRPLGASREPACRTERLAAQGLVQAHGSDTLSFFKLRCDVRYLFAPDRRAFLAYQVQDGVMLIAGDPVGALEALPDLLRETISFAETRGLRVAALGAGRPLLPLYRQAGLRPLYLGDEAIISTSFSLEGRSVRKVRQSVSRLGKAGYHASLHELASLDEAALEELGQVSRRWRGGAPEKGFAMALDSLGGEHQEDSLVVVARDAEGRARGFLHFVPSYGRPAMSLSFMRREPDTPNGLMEFLVVRAIGLLRPRGIEEISLNFAAFARVMHRPSGSLEWAVGRVLALANPFFQIESLYRFNAKFEPRWEPRYLVYDRMLALPRIGVAAMALEGQLPVLRRALVAGRA